MKFKSRVALEYVDVHSVVVNEKLFEVGPLSSGNGRDFVVNVKNKKTLVCRYANSL